MKNILKFDDYVNQPLNEGVIGRFFIKTLMGIINTLFNIKSLITRGKVTPYWTVNVFGNVIDFFIKLKRNANYLDLYEGNILDEYTEIHGHTIFEDLNRLKAHQEEYLEEFTDGIKRARIRSSIDKIDEIIDMCNEINQINQQRGQGFNVGRRLPNVPNFQQRLNQAAAEHGFDGQEWEEDDGVNQGPDPDQAEFKE